MLSHAKEHESLTGKLLLSTALVAVTVGFGYWQAGVMGQQQAAAIAAMQAQMQAQTAAAQPQTQAQSQAMSAPQPAAPDAGANNAVAADAPAAADNSAASSAPSNKLAMASPQSAAPQNSASAMNAQPQTGASPAPTQNVLLPATPPPPMPAMQLTGMDAIRAFLPTEGVSPPLPVVTGTPDPGATPPIPAGTHLEDGDYESDRVQFEWGDLRAKIFVTGGKITGVQIVSYPDHRSQSLYLIQLADPILTTEVIKTQQFRVNTVSSATNSSIAFRDAIQGAIIKATRGS